MIGWEFLHIKKHICLEVSSINLFFQTNKTPISEDREDNREIQEMKNM